MLRFDSAQQLNEWLTSKGIDTAHWGKGEAKSAIQLWAEITSGESQIEDNPPLRVVNVVDVTVYNGNKVLVVHQS